jgi:large subunit ribosomal protein L31
MKNGIHPKYNPKTKVSCACGAKFEMGSTEDEIKVEICSQCHPLYTGNMKFVDTAGRLDRFQTRLDKSKKLQDELDKQKSEKKVRQEGKDSSTKAKKEISNKSDQVEADTKE